MTTHETLSTRIFSLSCRLAIVQASLVGKAKRDAIGLAIEELDAIRLQVFQLETAQTLGEAARQ